MWGESLLGIQDYFQEIDVAKKSAYRKVKYGPPVVAVANTGINLMVRRGEIPKDQWVLVPDMGDSRLVALLNGVNGLHVIGFESDPVLYEEAEVNLKHLVEKYWVTKCQIKTIQGPIEANVPIGVILTGPVPSPELLAWTDANSSPGQKLLLYGDGEIVIPGFDKITFFGCYWPKGFEKQRAQLEGSPQLGTNLQITVYEKNI